MTFVTVGYKLSHHHAAPGKQPKAAPRAKAQENPASAPTSTYRDLKTTSLPQEMGAEKIRPGAYSLHYYGEAAGIWQQWDGRSAEALAEADQDEALAAGAADPENGEVATLEVAVLLVAADGECYELDRTTL